MVVEKRYERLIVRYGVRLDAQDNLLLPVTRLHAGPWLYGGKRQATSANLAPSPVFLGRVGDSQDSSQVQIVQSQVRAD
jgi:hypothetical protein